MSTLEKLKAYFGMVPADDEYGAFDDHHHLDHGYDLEDDYRDPRPPVRRAPRRMDDLRDLDHEEELALSRPRRVRPAEPAVAGSLAMDREPERVTRLRPVAAEPIRDPLSRIITLHPSGYVDAREIGEAFRDGNPVIMNLTEMDTPDAKRLVDFAAGLAFALRGDMDKVTNKVFLLTPSDANVTAEDRQRIAEGGLFLRR